ncbi:hypothetical protein [Caballeronia sp. DA-9]|uniref:hypothetical protein n=1 Tax=Caballeronia sp. DA-9 TaxID=3436237 RepID=UPI003F66945B
MPHSTVSMHMAAAVKATMKAAGIRTANVIVAHLIEMVVSMEVVKTVDKNKAHARANEEWRTHVPRVDIRILRNRIGQQLCANTGADAAKLAHASTIPRQNALRMIVVSSKEPDG